MDFIKRLQCVVFLFLCHFSFPPLLDPFYACHPFFLCFYATPFLILFIFLHMVVGNCVFMLVYNSFWLFKAPCIPLSLWQYCNDIDLWSIPPCYVEIVLLKWVRSRYKNLQSCKHKLQNKQKSMQSSTTKIHTYAHKHTHIHMYAHCMKGKVSMNSPKKFLALSTICSRK